MNIADHGALEASTHGLKRSPHWRAFRREHLKLDSSCNACPPQYGIMNAIKKVVGIIKLEVHHIIPFHICILIKRPDLELDHRNLITLCSSDQNHHLMLGHLDSFESWNTLIRDHAVGLFSGMSKDDIIKDDRWLMIKEHRPIQWAAWEDADQQHLIDYVNGRFPKGIGE